MYDTKSTLEIQIKARTKALEEEKATLEIKVGNRTKELQEKVNELQRFRKLVVKRELKMIDLKKR